MVLFWPALVWAQSSSATAELRALLSNLPGKQAVCGALVRDLQTGETIYSQSATTPLKPASNQKLFVMSAAVDMLGPDWIFRTRLAIRGADLVIIGDGDPALGDPRIAEAAGESPLACLDRWAESLKAAGYARVAGDLVIDASIFDQQFVHPDWTETDLLKWYGAPIGGLNFNDNCVELTVWPDAGAGAPALWELFPPCSAANVINRCESVPGGGQATPVVGRRAKSFDLILSGKVAKRSTLASISVPQPNLFVARVVRDHLASQGVVVAGQIVFEQVRERTSELPPDCRVVAEHTSRLADVLHRIGRNSQNMFAECLCKRLGYEWALRQGDARPVGSWENGRLAVSAVLARAGCDTSRLVLSDASGLSHSNRATAADLVAVLDYMYRHPQRKLFATSLAGNRTGGTLGKRLKSLDADVYAKTGYIRGVRTLSGYVRTAGQGEQDGEHWVAFSVLFNGFNGSSAPYNEIHDRMCRVLARTAGQSSPQRARK